MRPSDSLVIFATLQLIEVMKLPANTLTSFPYIQNVHGNLGVSSMELLAVGCLSALISQSFLYSFIALFKLFLTSLHAFNVISMFP